MAHPFIRGIHSKRSVQPSDEWDQTLLEDFANCGGSADEVVRFTRRYGPLEARLRLGEKLDTSFQIAEWRRLQQEFRDKWNALSPKRMQVIPIPTDLPGDAEEEFQWWFSKLSYRTANLYRLLLLELYSIPPRKLKRCVGPTCVTPYFIADHLLQKYCISCRTLTRLERKRRWWSKNRSSGGTA
jgi:hypothetical protein